MPTQYQSSGSPLNSYELSRSDHRRQRDVENMHRWVEEQLAKAPPFSEEQAERLREMFRLDEPRQPWRYMRWRVRLYCGHVVEVERPRAWERPDGQTSDHEQCTECGKEPAIIVAFEPIAPVGEPPGEEKRSPTPVRPRTRRTNADLEAENTKLRTEVERLRRSAQERGVQAARLQGN
ncbi:hypothetical protein [Streptomyces oceani]|uniref:hypothetical protein n=1 Tax=Streptomyces oceani TaxID=1075402 RepID=UPI000AF6E8D1|nr:hypothetical protein [Streptomyces oceani]